MIHVMILVIAANQVIAEVGMVASMSFNVSMSSKVKTIMYYPCMLKENMEASQPCGGLCEAPATAHVKPSPPPRNQLLSTPNPNP